MGLFAGFLFDRQDLIRELGLERDSSNVDLLLASWDRWQDDLFDHLDGNYLAAVWDANEQCLTLGRDAMGFYALYYSVHQEQLWFGPNVLSLAHSGRIPKSVNRSSLALRLVNSTPSHGETFFEGIHRIPPGHRLRWKQSGDPALVSYWDPLPADNEPWLPDGQVLAEFEPRLQRAVDRCLQLCPDGITLSGGLDSSTIAALATVSRARDGQRPLTAYSAVAPSGYSADEGQPWQRPVTRLLGLPHRTSDACQRLGNRSLMEANLEEFPRLPAPTTVWWVGAFLGFYRSIAQQGGRILLTGNGGDDWLGVPEWWAADLLRSSRLARATRFLRSYIDSGGRSWRYGIQELLWRQGLRKLIESQWARWSPGHRDRFLRQRLAISIPPWLCPRADDRQTLIETLHSRRAALLGPSGRTPASYLRHLNQHALENPFVIFERERNFHEERMVGLVFLHPFLDRRWLEFVGRISPEALLHEGRYKGLLRPILSRHLPGLGIDSQRKIYPAPTNNFLIQSLASSLPGVWRSSRPRALDALSLVDLDHLPEAIDGESTSHGQRVRYFMILSTETWLTEQL